MRRIVKPMVLGLVVFLLLGACKPSDKYAGEWYANSNDGEVKVDFSEEKVMTVEGEGNKTETYDFNQNSSGFINEVKYYGIEMEGDTYYVVFDDKKMKIMQNLLFKPIRPVTLRMSSVMWFLK